MVVGWTYHGSGASSSHCLASSNSELEDEAAGYRLVAVCMLAAPVQLTARLGSLPTMQGLSPQEVRKRIPLYEWVHLGPQLMFT